MSDYRILCTGGAGYVGSACLRYLLRNGHEAFAFDNLSCGNRAAVPDPDNRLVVGDINDWDALVSVFKQLKINAVMHFAAVASVPQSINQPELYWRTNVLGTKSLLDAMLECNIWNIVFSSTAATYAFTAKMPIEETDPQIPETPYGTTKLACEHMLKDYATAYGLGCTGMRYFNASGADPDGEFGEDRSNETHLIPLALYAAVGRTKSINVCGTDWDTRDGTCVRDYVHVEDIASAHVLAMENQDQGQASFYNIGSNEGVTVNEIIDACESIAGVKIDRTPAPRRPGDPAELIASADKLSSELGWLPRYDTIEQIVETAHRWHNKYPNGYADK